MNDGVSLEDQTFGGGTVDGECREGPKIDREPNEGETISVGEGTVTITDVHYEKEDGEKEAIGFDWTSSGVGLCNVSIFGGNRTRNNEYDCATGGTALAPLNQNSGTLSGISHFTLHYCDGDARGNDCFPNPTTPSSVATTTIPRTPTRNASISTILLSSDSVVSAPPIRLESLRFSLSALFRR